MTCGLLFPLLAVFAQAQQPEPIALIGALIIDVETGAVRAGQTIHIVRGRIAAIAPDAAARLPSTVRRIPINGKFVLPGLWDAHVHLRTFDQAGLGLLLAHGVTAIRLFDDDLTRTREWKREVASGSLKGPRIWSSGAVLERADYARNLERMDSLLNVRRAAGMLRTRAPIASSAQAEQVVDSLARAGADFIKMRTSTSRELYLAVVGAAHARGLRVIAHNPGQAGIAEAVRAGLSSIEHGFFPPLDDLTRQERAEIFQTLAERGTYFTPTLVSLQGFRFVPDSTAQRRFADPSSDPSTRYATSAALEDWQWQVDSKQLESPFDWPGYLRGEVRDIAEMRQAGVRFLAGTDAGAPLVTPGVGLHTELSLLVNVGKLTTLEALQAATVNPARWLGVADSLGSIEVGKLADLVVLDANPLERITATQQIHGVVRAGRWLDGVALNAIRDNAMRGIR